VLDKSVPHPRILLIGADGQVGWELRRTLAPLGRLINAASPWFPTRRISCSRAIRHVPIARTMGRGP